MFFTIFPDPLGKWYGYCTSPQKLLGPFDERWEVEDARDAYVRKLKEEKDAGSIPEGR